MLKEQGIIVIVHTPLADKLFRRVHRGESVPTFCRNTVFLTPALICLLCVCLDFYRDVSTQDDPLRTK